VANANMAIVRFRMGDRSLAPIPTATNDQLAQTGPGIQTYLVNAAFSRQELYFVSPE
jgi:hypothetical protein